MEEAQKKESRVWHGELMIRNRSTEASLLCRHWIVEGRKSVKVNMKADLLEGEDEGPAEKPLSPAIAWKRFARDQTQTVGS
jgi:hypothetical protein